MKSLNTYINETLKFSQREYINEWTLNSDNTNNVKKENVKDCQLIYEIESNGDHIKVIDRTWPGFETYRHKVYINGNRYELSDNGSTIAKFARMKCTVEIRDIKDVTDCENMFLHCFQLKEVRCLNVNKVQNMESMFQDCGMLETVENINTDSAINMAWMFVSCKNLKNVSLLNTNKVTSMITMFHGCDKLSEETKQIWSSVYDFKKERKK